MTSRERVLAALAHKEPDRVPIDGGSMRSTGIMAVAYNRLKRHLGIAPGGTLLYDLVQQLAEPEPWFLDRFHIDAVDLGRAMPDRRWKPWTLPDGSPAQVPDWFEGRVEDGEVRVRDCHGTTIGRMPRSSIVIDQTFWPLGGDGGISDLAGLRDKMSQVIWAALPSSPWDRPLTIEGVNRIACAARHLYENSEYCVSLSLGCNLLEWSQFLFGMENAYLQLAGDRAAYIRFLEKLTELHLSTLDMVLPSVRGLVQVLVFGDDLGTQRGPQISRHMYREVFLPFHKAIFQRAKKLCGGAVFMHSCGGIYDLIPDLIEAGVEILNPVQTSARNMEPERLKREFGKDLAFWGGGCDTQRILSRGTPAEVRDDVRRRLDIFMPGGGFVWTQIHNITAEVPPENIMAMFETIWGYGVYQPRVRPARPEVF
jgi:uroporphyrinogen decarboxylase